MEWGRSAVRGSGVNNSEQPQVLSPANTCCSRALGGRASPRKIPGGPNVLAPVVAAAAPRPPGCPTERTCASGARAEGEPLFSRRKWRGSHGLGVRKGVGRIMPWEGKAGNKRL